MSGAIKPKLPKYLIILVNEKNTNTRPPLYNGLANRNIIAKLI